MGILLYSLSICVGSSFFANALDDELSRCPNLAANIDRSMDGQCKALSETWTPHGLQSSAGPQIVFPAFLDKQNGWYNAFFVGIPKCGTSAISAMGGVRIDLTGAKAFGGYRPIPHKPTSYFTMIRDPLERFLSAFFETHLSGSFGCSSKVSSHRRNHYNAKKAKAACWKDIGESPLTSKHTEGVRNKTAILERLQALVEYVEHDGFFDVHLALQTYFMEYHAPERASASSMHSYGDRHHLTNSPLATQFELLHRYNIIPFDHVYHLRCIRKALQAMNISGKAYSAGTDHPLGSLAQKMARKGLRSEVMLRAADLPRHLALRICRLYQADYCCLGLPMSRQCDGFVPDCRPRKGPCLTKGSLARLRAHYEREVCSGSIYAYDDDEDHSQKLEPEQEVNQAARRCICASEV